MVAEAGLIAHTLKGAEGTLATILGVVLEKKRGIVDIDRVNTGRERWRHEHMVDGMPLAMIAIGALDTMESPSLSRNVGESGVVE